MVEIDRQECLLVAYIEQIERLVEINQASDELIVTTKSDDEIRHVVGSEQCVEPG